MREDILQAVLRERTVFVIGAKDTGKTTLVKDLANACFHQGYSVGIIDADVGQSDIGPPTTIGLGIVKSPLEQLSDAKVHSMYFVGSPSPKGHVLPMLIGVRQMLDRALALNVQKILIDTTGLVSGQLGRILKESKVAIVQPDLIVCLQVNAECEHLLRQYEAFEKPRILRLLPDTQCRHRTQAERRNYRETAFQEYFAHAKPVVRSLTGISIFGTPLFHGQPLSPQDLQELSTAIIPATHIAWGEIQGKELLLVTSDALKHEHYLRLKQVYPDINYVRDYVQHEFEDVLVGLLDRHGECCALGILRSIDFVNRQITILTTADKENIAGVRLSDYPMRNA